MKLSKGMLKCIEEAKEEALRLMEDIPTSMSMKVKRKPTKNKVFEFQFINLGKPVIRLFINDRFYASYFYTDKKWKEER